MKEKESEIQAGKYTARCWTEMNDVYLYLLFCDRMEASNWVFAHPKYASFYKTKKNQFA